MVMQCGICNDDLCVDHEEDCVFFGTPIEAMFGPCVCPNSKESQ